MSDVIRPNKSRFGCLHILVILTAGCMLASLFIPTFGRISKKGNITIGISNCRQIINAMKTYASDYGGDYPDASLTEPQHSNEVFRILIQKNITHNEKIFGCPVSSFVPDGKIGNAPDFQQALEAGENHWAMTTRLSDSHSGGIPLVYENPVVAIWSPKWSPDAKGTNTRGRSWSNGVIVGLNDSSVSIQPLASKTGTEVPLKELGEGMNLFTLYSDPSGTSDFEVLNVEVKP